MLPNKFDKSLNSKVYTPVSVSGNVQIDTGDHCHSIAVRLSKSPRGDKLMISTLMCDLRGHPMAAIVAVVAGTVKTHKDARQVELRLLHSSVCYSQFHQAGHAFLGVHIQAAHGTIQAHTPRFVTARTRLRHTRPRIYLQALQYCHQKRLHARRLRRYSGMCC